MLNQWSYSRLTAYEQCPQKVKFKVIDKLPDPAGPAADRGTYWHSVLEKYVGPARLDLPDPVPGGPDLSLFVPQLQELRDRNAQVERQVAFNTLWQPVAFFASDAWGRMVFDVQYYDEPSYTVHTIDYKTGKTNATHANQLDLYAAVGYLLYPEAKLSVSENWYLDLGPQAKLPRAMNKAASTHVLKRWENAAQKMSMDTEFKPRPGQHCRWCAFAKSKGGVCLFG